ncbi:zinc-ribbon domain-containing protein, partial [Salmonella enterica]
MERFCENCGNEMSDSNKFCEKCGNQIIKNESNTNTKNK